MIEYRRYVQSDCKEMADLFYNTIHSVNARDYTAEQLDAWATGTVDLKSWNLSFLKHHTLVASDGNEIVGFADMDSTGYLDRLFVHKDYQGMGIASALCDRLEALYPQTPVTTYASITARPFFEKRGYRVVKRQQAECRGAFLTNFEMKKQQP